MQKRKRAAGSAHIHFQAGNVAKLEVGQAQEKVFAIEPVGIPIDRTRLQIGQQFGDDRGDFQAEEIFGMVAKIRGGISLM